MILKSLGKSALSFVGDIYKALIFRISVIYSAFDIKPVFFIGGLATTTYGVYLRFSLGTSLIFCGFIFMLLGYFMGGKR